LFVESAHLPGLNIENPEYQQKYNLAGLSIAFIFGTSSFFYYIISREEAKAQRFTQTNTHLNSYLLMA